MGANRSLCARTRPYRGNATSQSGRLSARWRTFLLVPPRIGTKGFSYFKTPLRFWEHSPFVRCGFGPNESRCDYGPLMRILIAEDDAALADFVRQGLREGSIMRWTWWKIGSRRAPRERVRLRVGDFGLEPAGARRSEWVTSFAAEVEDRGAVSGYRTMTIGRSRFRSANYRRASGRCCGAPTRRRSRCWYWKISSWITWNAAPKGRSDGSSLLPRSLRCWNT